MAGKLLYGAARERAGWLRDKQTDNPGTVARSS